MIDLLVTNALAGDEISGVGGKAALFECDLPYSAIFKEDSIK